MAKERSIMDSNAEFEVHLDLGKRTIVLRMKGLFSEDDMRAFASEYRRATDRFQRRKHMVIADMRGMKAIHPTIAKIMGAEIAYARGHGVVLCAHVSDDTVQRLQARRLARENALTDDVSVDVTSVEEAQKVVDEARRRINDRTGLTSIRAPA